MRFQLWGSWRARISGPCLAAILSMPALGQSSWPSYPNNSTITVTSAGDVGIGTTSPSSGHLQIETDTNFPAIYLVGNSAGWGSGIQFYNTGYAPGRNYGMYAGADGTFHLVDNTAAVPRVSFTPAGNVVLQWAGGNVGIGTTNPQHLLHVAGTIGAEEVIVSSTGADYVFQPGYRLRPLSEVNAFIQQNHHLPDIPSDAEVKKNGLSLGDMQAKLLAKVEELTLHMIEADERSKRDEERNKSLEQQNRELQERVARLEAAEKEKGPK